MTPMRVFTLVVFAALPAAAQWIHLPTPGIPRAPDKQPNLTAPAPKTADGRPDFSGMWVPRDPLPCDPNERGVLCTELPVNSQTVNFAAGLKGGLPYQPWAAELIKSRAQDSAMLDPHVSCMPPNFPRAWAFPETEKILQTPGELAILHEYNASYRQIFFDGRRLPDEMTPTWNGYSVGHWDGDALVVDSAGYRDDSWLDTRGNFFSGEATVTERIRRPTFGSLDIDVTVNDAKVFTRSWTVTLHMKLVADTELIDLYCQDNNKDLKHMFR